MKKSQARGYLLEDALEKLIKVNGYDIVSQSNGDDIIQGNNGLRVRGRGGEHQFDSLGEFKITPPLMFPMRLFVEAKFYTEEKVQIDKIRMAVGILQDVNTNYSTVTSPFNQLNLTKYDYHYALFSTSGFSLDAQKMALAHKVNLIDLRDNQLNILKNLIKDIVDELYNMTSNEEDDIPSDMFKVFRSFFKEFISIQSDLTSYQLKIQIEPIINNFKTEIRLMQENIGQINPNDFFENLNELVEKIRKKSIYLASTRSSQVIALIPDNDNVFMEALRKNPHQEVLITWNELSGDWFVEPVKPVELRDNSYRLTFRLPELFVRELASNLQNIEEEAMNLKESKLSRMSFIAYLDNQNPTLCTLKFNRELTMEHINRFQNNAND